MKKPRGLAVRPVPGPHALRYNNRIIGWATPRLRADGTVVHWDWRTLGDLHQGVQKSITLALHAAKEACGWA